MKNCESLNLQYASNLPSSSADLKATKNGWPSNPTRKSEKARQNNSVNDGEWSSLVFQITNIVAPLAITVVYANKEVTTHDTTLTVTLWLECCQKTSKKKHVRFVSLTFDTFVAIDPKGENGEVASVCCLPSVVRTVQRFLSSLIFFLLWKITCRCASLKSVLWMIPILLSFVACRFDTF